MKSDAKIFADDTSLFVVVDDPLTAHEILMYDLHLVEKWAKHWRMSFNPDSSKPPFEVTLSTKINPPLHARLFFNDAMVKLDVEQNHVGLSLIKLSLFTAILRRQLIKLEEELV